MKRLPCIACILLGVLLFAPGMEAQNPGMVKDILPGTGSAFFSGTNTIVTRDVLNGKIFFSADNGANGQEIFSSSPSFDATSTLMLKDMTPGMGGTSEQYHAAYDKLFFISPATVNRDAVCRSDGTTPGTSMLYAPTLKKGTVHSLRAIRSSQGMIFFTRLITKTGTPVLSFTGELWKTDPASGASILLKSGGNFGWMESVNSTMVVFECNFPGNSPYGRLYASNGTSKGTKLIYTLPTPSFATSYPPNPHPYGRAKTFCVGGISVFFEWNDAVNGSELWKSDGTASGTMRVTDINPGTGSAFPAMGTVMNGYLYFSANDGSHGWQIWRYPVSGGTAERVTDIDGGTSGADPMWLTAVDGTLFFSANTPAAGRELWQSNGLPLSDPGTATALVADIYSGPLSSNPNYATAAMVDTDQKYQLTMATIGDWVYFPADDGTGYSLWRSNGTITEKLGSSQPRLLTPVSWIENNQARDMLLYVASTEAEGCELWKFDPSLWPPTPKRSVGPDVPVSFVLARNYPNPFNPTTVVEYRIPESGLVTLSVSDIHGRNVATLVDGWRPAGVSSVVFDASGLPAGTYICTLQTPGTKLRHKMSLVK